MHILNKWLYQMLTPYRPAIWRPGFFPVMTTIITGPQLNRGTIIYFLSSDCQTARWVAVPTQPWSYSSCFNLCHLLLGIAEYVLLTVDSVRTSNFLIVFIYIVRLFAGIITQVVTASVDISLSSCHYHNSLSLSIDISWCLTVYNDNSTISLHILSHCP